MCTKNIIKIKGNDIYISKPGLFRKKAEVIADSLILRNRQLLVTENGSGQAMKTVQQQTFRH